MNLNTKSSIKFMKNRMRKGTLFTHSFYFGHPRWQVLTQSSENVLKSAGEETQENTGKRAWETSVLRWG